MKKYILLSLFFFLAMSVASAQDATKREIPEGMEEIQIGGSAKLIVPKGAKIRKGGAQVIVEGTKEYMTRRFFEMEQQLTELQRHLADMEQRQADLLNQIETLKNALEKQKEIKKIAVPGAGNAN